MSGQMLFAATDNHSRFDSGLAHNMNTTRRTFIKTAAAASLLATVTPTFAAERERKNKGVIFKSNKGGGIGGTKDEMVATLQKYKSLGFDGLEGGIPNIKDLQALKEAIREVDFPVHGVVDGVHWQERLSSPDPKVRDIGREALIAAIKGCHEIGGSAVLLVPGRVSGDDENHDHVWHRSIEQIRQVLPVASRYGIRVLIENVWNGFCESPDQYRDYIDAIGSTWVGAYFDIGNVRKFGKPEDWIRVLGQRIVKLDVKDWGAKNGFCRLGEGDVDWPAVREALAEIGYTGWATREGGDKSLEDTAQLMDELLDL
ncbi:MAG: sugar phosphate isomerase/epimerase [Planctomycetaceae bacterium]|nr:sugar phosphate isomerase/epimerase [Planctomycetaceae bacterium]